MGSRCGSPTPEREAGLVAAQNRAEVLAVRDAALGSPRVVAPDHGHTRHAQPRRPAREHEAVLEGVLTGQEGHHCAEVGTLAEVGGEVGQALLLGVTGRVIGEKDEGALPGEALDRVVHVDPEIHAACGIESQAGRPQLNGGHRARLGEAPDDSGILRLRGGAAGAGSAWRRSGDPGRHSASTSPASCSIPVGSPPVNTSAPSSVISTSSSIRIPVPSSSGTAGHVPGAK